MQVKAYTSRVGSGPFPTELFGEEGDRLRKAGMEFGTTTGRPRRCGWLDIVALKYCCQINGFSSLNLTKLDVLSGLSEIKVGVSYNQADGQKLQSFPGDLDTLEQVQVTFQMHFCSPCQLNHSIFLEELCYFLEHNIISLSPKLLGIWWYQ
jgi:adenylosuccinate synthase